MALVAVTVSSCESPSGARPGVPRARVATSAPMTTQIALHFDDPGGGRGGTVAVNGGDLPIHTTVAAAAGGRVVVATTPAGDGYLRFPRLSAALTPPRAVLVVTIPPGAGQGDLLGPGTSDFAFGAQFVLDRASTRGDRDNGNNLMQRGLGVDPAQYKLQVDEGHLSCRVAGDRGVLLARSRQTIEPGEWYAASCARIGGTVTLRAREVLDGTVDRVSVTGPTGSVEATPTTPLAVGGKVTGAGTAVRGNSDQFNGGVDDVFLRIARP